MRALTFAGQLRLPAFAATSHLLWVASSACALLFAVGCGGPEPITQPYKLADGTEISAAQLINGRESYTLYCRACHGDKGDGRGPAGIGMRPPPRNFTEPAFKFGGVAAGELPPDAELMRIVQHGLDGTAMLPWQIPESDLRDVISYIKTFSVVWTEDEVGEVVEITDDPWPKDDQAGAIKRGKTVYHGLAQCSKCHPAYASRTEIWRSVEEMTGTGNTGAFRKDMYFPEAKLSEAYGNKILPPDFVRHPVKAGATPKELFRTIASGIGGTAMPMWKDSIPDKDIWAISHYVASLTKVDGAEMAKKRDAWVAAEQTRFYAPIDVKEGKFVVLEKIQFETGSDQIKADSKGLVAWIAKALQAHPEVKVVGVHGHTDATGDAKANLELSRRRAMSVAGALSGHGVKQELRPDGFGPSKPLCTEADDDCHARNRRVEFLVTE